MLLKIILLATRCNLLAKLNSGIVGVSQTLSSIDQTSNINAVFACFCHVKEDANNRNFQYYETKIMYRKNQNYLLAVLLIRI